MAIVSRISNYKLLKHTSPVIKLQLCTLNTEAAQSWDKRRYLYSILGLAAGGVGALIYALEQSVKAYDWPAHPPKYPWTFKKNLGAFDHASIRRGFEVYKNVCSACHSLEFIPFRRLVNVAFTLEEMKQLASEFTVIDGPNEEGEMYKRPGKLADYIPDPYPNEEAAAFANNGAAPPDLSLMAIGREGEHDYIFSLLMGYREAPAGVDVPENAYYNPYFQGSVIAMAPPLYDGIFEYSDGTPATKSQLAKDVVTFLGWCAQPEMERRKTMGIKMLMFFGLLLPIFGYVNRHKWTSHKAREVFFRHLASQYEKKH